MPRPEANNPGEEYANWTADSEVIAGGGAKDVNRAMAEGTPTVPDLKVIDGGKAEKPGRISVKEGRGIPLSDFDDAARTAEFQAVRAKEASAPERAADLSHDIKSGAYDTPRTEAGEHSVALAQFDAMLSEPFPEKASRAELQKMRGTMDELLQQVQKDFGETFDAGENLSHMKIGGSSERATNWLRRIGEIARRSNETSRPRGEGRVHEIPKKQGFADRVKGFFSRGQ